MATKSRSRDRVRAPARWYLDTGQDAWRDYLSRTHTKPADADPDVRADYLATKRALRLKTLTDNVKQLRQYFSGFDTDAGYDLRDIKQWDARRIRTVEQYGEYLNHLRSQPHSRVKPRTTKERKGLVEFTGQRLKRQKAYVVHKPSEADEIAVGSEGEIEIVRELPTGGFLRSYYYLFRTILGWQPVTWDEVIAATEEILPYLPEGNYFILSELHGEIDTPHPKRMLLKLLMRYEQEYSEKDFADTIIGFKRVDDRVTPSEEYRRIYERRQRYREEKARRWNQLRRQVQRTTRRKRK